MTGKGDIAERGPDVIAPPPLIYLAGLVGGLALDRGVRLPHLPRAARLAGIPLGAGGVALLAWFVSVMLRNRTPIPPDQPPTALVEEGPFQLTRNPCYSAFALIYAAATLLSGGRWSLILLPGVLAAIDQGVIRREEAYLEERFADRYRDYRRRVRRWV